MSRDGGEEKLARSRSARPPAPPLPPHHPALSLLFSLFSAPLFPPPLTTTPPPHHTHRPQSAFLKLIGIQPLDFCFMAAVAPGIMGLTAEHASGVAKYVVRAGARSAGSLATVLRDHPKLLEYTHDPEQGVLVKAAGKGGVGGEAAKAAIQHTPDGKIGVSFWRDGCRWNTAPVSPFKPMRLPPGPP